MHRTKSLKGYTLHGRDGEVGIVDEFFFDDNHWTIRYLVADTGSWLTGREVLISPYAVTSVHPETKYLTVDLTRKQIEESPTLESHKPVSRQFEENYYNYYGWPTYWAGPHSWGSHRGLTRDPAVWRRSVEETELHDPHLLSTRDVTGHHIQAADGEIGHVEDFIIDENSWAIRYLVVDTRNWLPGKRVLIAPKWIERVNWSESKVFINLSRLAVEKAPEFLPHSPLSRDYEVQLYKHYDRYGYWFEDLAAV